MKNNHENAKHPSGSANRQPQANQHRTEQKDGRSAPDTHPEGKRGTKSHGAQTKSSMRHSKPNHK